MPKKNKSKDVKNQRKHNIATLDEVTANAQKEIQENYKKIGTLQAAAANAQKEVQENYKKIGTFDEAAANAQKEVQENYKKIGTLQAASADAYKKVLENYKNIGFSSTFSANAFANKKLPKNYKEMASFFDEIISANMEYQKNFGNVDFSNPATYKNLEKKINKIMDKHKDQLDDIEAFTEEMENLPENQEDSDLSNSDIVKNFEVIKKESQDKINQIHDDNKVLLEKANDKDADFSVSEIEKNLDGIKKEYQDKIDQILDEYKDQFEKVKKVEYDFSNPETLKTLDDIKKEYQDKIDQILDEYKNQLEKVNNLEFGKAVNSQDELMKLSDVELMARVIYAEQATNLKGQNAVAWNIINKSKGNFRSVLTASKYSCLKGEGGNLQAFKPDVNSKGWENALQLAIEIQAGESNNIPNDIGDATEFRSKPYFDANSRKDGNVTYLKQKGPDKIIREYKVKNVKLIGGNVFFDFDYSK